MVVIISAGAYWQIKSLHLLAVLEGLANEYVVRKVQALGTPLLRHVVAAVGLHYGDIFGGGCTQHPYV